MIPDNEVTIERLARGFKVTLQVFHIDSPKPHTCPPAHYEKLEHARTLAAEWARIFRAKLIDRTAQ